MIATTDPHLILTPEQLAGLYGEVDENSIKKEISFVHPHYRAMIEASPFALLATSDCDFDGETYDQELPARQRSTLY
ncbi:MAG TPA: hypothetical protein VFE33_02075 [Thermoanaerobaculia bacterium]|nr:hypothetical protein [Thermoanaerobaculia bacterium]